MLGLDMEIPEGATRVSERTCDSCERPEQAPYRIEPRVVNSRSNPANQVVAMVVLASEKPPTTEKAIVENGQKRILSVRNPEFDPMKMVIVATFERGFDFCSQDCLHNEIDRLFHLAEERTKKLWGGG